ncbi:hypothetical protein TBLA_0D00960 [Henningerozyma blattae CBS 6284]|uniref:rRNA biogenesis protein RRP5 n=1 Tax=Henningerozyma blattae (strain ATCC 34711 / CBS 6284 / DSM 70876 / NBRC 10599 / NRRL Y-10934 / UCD 77-7) TaxID=1071380 RepID=I2H2K2_HENB6|nr:hypothetical protein TBLA_0D00960 [Tetrapisispora blattae CBS 6284]CCH60604.1 hypothetical protein TBLA_0D00960 [Tetrapisispora blattae CBS 6284]
MAPSSKRKRDEEFPLSRQDATTQPAQSLLKNSDEVSFPRGGSSVLTPLELKQVANEAASDVLFAQKEKSTKSQSFENDRPKKKKKITKKNKNSEASSTELDESVNVVEHINFKNLKVGSILLGQITSTTKKDLCVTFTDGISGYVPITHISDHITHILEDIDDDMSDEEEKDECEKEENTHDFDELPNLNKYFKIGQWLRCSVIKNTALDAVSKKHHKKRIELSIEPSVVNPFSAEDLEKHSTVQCSVKSLEDHGATLDLGLENVTGFISKKDVPDFETLLPGSVFLANIYKKSGRSIIVNTNFSAKNSKVSHISSIDAVVPGQMVDFLCDDISSNGISGKIFGLVSSFIGISHLRTFTEEELKETYSAGSNIKCRIIASLLNKNDERVLIVSTLDQIVSLDNNIAQTEAIEAFPIGYTFDSASFLGSDSDFVYLALNEDLFGAVHRSKLGDIHISGDIQARVIGYNTIDKIYQLSTDPNALKLKYIRAADIPNGELVTGCEIINVSSDGIELKIFNGQFSAFVPPLHISDVKLSYPERKFKIGSKIKGRILEVTKRGHIIMTLKKSLVNDENKIVDDYVSAKQLQNKNEKTVATVESFKPNGCLISFFGGLRGFLPNSEISEAFVRKPEQHLRLGQTVIIKILDVDEKRFRVIASCKASNEDSQAQKLAIEKLVLGRSIIEVNVVEKTKDSVVVEDADSNLRGVIYVGHLSDSRIEQNRATIKKIKIGSKLTGVVIDKDDRTRVFNLSMKKSLIDDAKNKTLPISFSDIISLDKTTPLHGYIKSISNTGIFVAFNGKFVGLVLPSYAVESRDVDINKSFYVNQSVTSYLLRTDEENERFLLTLKNSKADQTSGAANASAISQSTENLDTIKVGDKIPARIVKVSGKHVILDLGNKITGVSFITDALNDYSVSLSDEYQNKLNKTIDATVISINTKAKKVNLSLRTNEAKQHLIESHNDIKQGDVVHGLIKNINDSGVFIYLSTNIDAFVPVSKLSDSYLKDWKKFYNPLQHVIGKVVSCESDDRILVTLRESEVNGDLKILKDYSSIEVGEIFNGNVKNVTDFGVFVKLDNTVNVTGLAHKSEIADDKIPDDLSALFGAGDRVKAIVLRVNAEKKQVSLGLKASYFSNDNYNEESNEKPMEENTEEKTETIQNADADEVIEFDNESDEDVEMEEAENSKIPISTNGLSLSTGFDWTASILDQTNDTEESEDDGDFTEIKKKSKSKKNHIVEDKTIDINTRTPESVADFERLIIGNPNSSVVWMNYMAFQLQLSEIEKAREIAERALKIINFREEAEKLNIWIAMLNLENTFGTEETLEDVFKRACQYMDSYTIHNKLISIYQMSEKLDRAAELFKTTAKKFGSEKLSIWTSWGDFLLAQNNAQEARAILANALKSLPKRNHIDIVKKFAQLEFAKGDAERGRSLFEGLIADAPKRIDIWNVYLDQEIKINEKKKVEDLFERVFTRKITRKQAKFFFNKWLVFEEGQKDDKMTSYVKAKATEFVANLGKSQSV